MDLLLAAKPPKIARTRCRNCYWTRFTRFSRLLHVAQLARVSVVNVTSVLFVASLAVVDNFHFLPLYLLNLVNNPLNLIFMNTIISLVFYPIIILSYYPISIITSVYVHCTLPNFLCYLLSLYLVKNTIRLNCLNNIKLNNKNKNKK